MSNALLSIISPSTHRDITPKSPTSTTPQPSLPNPMKNMVAQRAMFNLRGIMSQSTFELDDSSRKLHKAPSVDVDDIN